MWGGNADDVDRTCAGCGKSVAVTDRMKERLKQLRSRDVKGFKSALHRLGWPGANALRLPGRITAIVCDGCMKKLGDQMKRGGK